ncbi:MAG: Maf-like protein [Candidatus Acididesulfobacter guangdongensis]|uniref:dTTP/UTP pyrophosphatase n=1 Tax=Acididesulfobacter guangdongensis TaxID=2597225 RepID=A0A519BIK7_ACIG2|nr:MAG: Maf-like protein [Candidatus Acididesulfobacter guangdongensis]
MIKPCIILASSSPRRSDILKEYKIDFIAAEHKIINEPEYSGDIEPFEFAENLALDKAKSIENRYPDCFIIGSDTVVIFDDLSDTIAHYSSASSASSCLPPFSSTVNLPLLSSAASDTLPQRANRGLSLGKPKDAVSAFNMLSMLSGNAHNVYTGVALINKNMRLYESAYDKTEVKIKKLSDEEIYGYIRESKPFDKAGAYGIQDSQNIVESYSGSYKNAEGLCIEKLIPLLKRYNLI